jgi:poly(A) polymerase
MDDSDPRSKPPCHREDAMDVVRALRDAGHVAYFAGGCVRDLLLGLEPKDYDVATDAVPQKVRSLFRNTQAVGQAFGVILARLGRSVVEIATFRTDGKYVDGRHPEEVQFTTAEEDAKRRDFTINGLFFDPIENRVLDFVGGREDLTNKILRAIGDPEARFEEDHLRLLRAIRFAARFDLTIEPVTQKAIVDNAEHLVRISPERIGDELRLMLTATTRVTAWKHLGDMRLLPVFMRFLPETSAWPPNAAPLFPGVAAGRPIGLGVALAAMTLCYRRNAPSLPPMHSLLTPEEIRRSVQACRRALKISNDESDAMAGALDVLPLLGDEPPSVARMKRFLARPHSGDSRWLLDAMLMAEPTLARINWLRERFAELEKTDVAPPPLVTGDDLTAAGLVPGPLFKRVLDAVYDAQLEGRVRSREEALALALRMVRQ